MVSTLRRSWLSVVMMFKKLSWLLGVVVLVACGRTDGATPSELLSEPVIVPTPSMVPVPASPTPEPLVARVNGVPISVAEYEAQVKQIRAAPLAETIITKPSSDGAEPVDQQILAGMIDQLIVEQAAQTYGVSVSETVLDQEIGRLKQEQTEAYYQAWLRLNDFSEADFRSILRSQLLASALFSAVIEPLPMTTEQVHTRQILLDSLDQAETILARLQAEDDFVTLARQFSLDEASRPYGGDLGWFPRNMSPLPVEVEAVAFTLASGQVSVPIKSELGYHIIKLELRDDDRPLTPQQIQLFRRQMFDNWLAQQRASAQIELFVN